MELTTLKATSRVLGANRDNKRLRKAGQIPAVYYGKGTETVNISVSEIDIRKVLAPGKRYTLLDLEIDGKAGNPAVIYNYQKDAISQKFVHIDFLKIDEATPVKVRVPVKLSGLPVGVKTQGGVMAQETHYLMLSAKPASIPTVLELDISDFETNVTFYAKDFKLPEGVTLASVPRTVIFSISSKSKKKDAADAAAPAAEAAAPAAAAAAPAAEAKLRPLGLKPGTTSPACPRSHNRASLINLSRTQQKQVYLFLLLRRRFMRCNRNTRHLLFTVILKENSLIAPPVLREVFFIIHLLPRASPSSFSRMRESGIYLG